MKDKLFKKNITLKNDKYKVHVHFWFNNKYYSVFISKLINHVIISINDLTVDIFNDEFTFKKD